MPYDQMEIQAIKHLSTPPNSFQWRHLIWNGKIGPAFWTISSLVSMLVNIILVILLILMGRQLFMLKSLVQDQLLGGLYSNFQMMDNAHIHTTIPINTYVPAKFNLPVITNTTVQLTQDTTIKNMTISNLNAGALFISSAQADITLPAGTDLPIALNITVPVDKKIPVKLLVDVDIPLNKTELHSPFVGLQEVVKPYYTLLNGLPSSWQATVCAVVPDSPCAK